MNNSGFVATGIGSITGREFNFCPPLFPVHLHICPDTYPQFSELAIRTLQLAITLIPTSKHWERFSGDFHSNE